MAIEKTEVNVSPIAKIDGTAYLMQFLHEVDNPW